VKPGNAELFSLTQRFKGPWNHIEEADAEFIERVLHSNGHRTLSVDRAKLDQSYEAWVHLLVEKGTEGLSGFGDCVAVLTCLTATKHGPAKIFAPHPQVRRRGASAGRRRTRGGVRRDSGFVQIPVAQNDQRVKTCCRLISTVELILGLNRLNFLMLCVPVINHLRLAKICHFYAS
jgi:hypothetical protein